MLVLQCCQIPEAFVVVYSFFSYAFVCGCVWVCVRVCVCVCVYLALLLQVVERALELVDLLGVDCRLLGTLVQLRLQLGDGGLTHMMVGLRLWKRQVKHSGCTAHYTFSHCNKRLVSQTVSVTETKSAFDHDF